MIIQTGDALIELLRNKRIALLVFNKDTRNLLRFYQAGMRVTDFSIPYNIRTYRMGYDGKEQDIS